MSTKKSKDLEDRIAEAIDAAEAETGDQPVAEEAATTSEPQPAGVFYFFYKAPGLHFWSKSGPFATKRDACAKALELAGIDCELMIVKLVGSVEWQKVAKIV